MEIKHVNEANFVQEVVESDVPVLVDFYADWCGPCKMLSPTIEKIAKESNQYKVVKINADESNRLLSRYNVASIPTLIVFHAGKEVNRSVGLVPKEQIVKMLAV